MEEMLRAENLCYRYTVNEETQETLTALQDVNLQVKKGEFIAILGHNGSGKSTLARHINALLCPTEGTLWIEGMDSNDPKNTWNIRQKAGMIFQNPDNQMVASIIEEDVAFGPENLGVPPEEIRERVRQALEAVDMLAYAQGSPARLSGGQKQRIAIAGILAMQTECIVLDEPTAMLDPSGRKDLMDTILRLNHEQGITVIHITHYMEETIEANRVIVVDHGRIVMEGTPREVFVQVEKLRELGLDVPPMTELAWELRQQGYQIRPDILTVEEMVEALCQSKSKI